MKTLMVIALGLSLVAAACGDDDGDKAATAADAPKITIGAQNFGESALLAEVYKQGLEAKGFDVSVQKLGGFRDLEVKAFDGKTINFAPEYAASMLEFLNSKKGEASGDVVATVKKLESYLLAKGLTVVAHSEAVDTNAFVVTKATADKYGLKTLSDLAANGEALKLGGPTDCETNAYCIPGLKTKYGVDLKPRFQALETGQIVPALDAGSIDVALLFSTDGRIKAKNYVLLDDDKKMALADNVVPVMTVALGRNKDLVEAVNAITATLTTEKLIDMNKRFDVDKEDAAVIAKDYLAAENLD
jgi:osmoprotectant transport system substrate-binding protein